MRGDVLIIEAQHRRAADALAGLIVNRNTNERSRLAVGIAGESGSGKSELAQALHDALDERKIASVILQQDDYFRYPPKTNDSLRRRNIDWVGPQEVELDRLDRDVETIVSGATFIDKPLVDYTRDRIEHERFSTAECRVAIVEGTYVLLLRSVDLRVFIDRDFHQTLEARCRRARDTLDVFGERVLAIEHEIIRQHRRLASVVVTSDFSVEIRKPLTQESTTRPEGSFRAATSDEKKS